MTRGKQRGNVGAEAMAGQFRYTAAAGGGPVGEIVRFVEEGGKVIRMYTGDGYVERVR